MEIRSKIESQFGNKVNCIYEYNELTVEIDPKDLLSCCHTLKGDEKFSFEQLTDLCGVDYLHYGVTEWSTASATGQGFSRGVENSQKQAATTNKSNRFAVVYHLLSIKHNCRIRLRTFLQGEPPRVPSVLEVWSSANWYEREAFDLFGILFENHPDLRRILTDYGFIGNPFRKDFPLSGQVEMRYDASEQRVIYEPVNIEPRTLVPKVIRYKEEVSNE